jgi:DNA primase catalytic core
LRFTQDFIEKVREANNIAEIIGQHTELKGTGHRLMGRCPFPDHSDKSPSFSVGEDNQLYYCYGCKKGGNLYTFLETFNGMSFPEAVEFLARRANIALPETDEGGNKRTGLSHDQKDLYLKINRLAAVHYHHNLKSMTEEHASQKYLVKRGLNAEIVEKFRLGLSTDDWSGLGKLFESKGVPLSAGEALGLLKPKKNPPKSGPKSDQYFDLFRERLMFPIFSPTGDVIGFGGRTLTDQLPKYVNSSDSPVFNKSRVLYGLHETGKFIRAQDEAIVVEGYMDAISLYAAGIKNVVAILGTAFTPEHAKLLKRYTLNVKMLLDGDEAGINAADRSLPVLLEAGLMPKGFILPEKMDPDDFVRANGAEALKMEISRAPELFNLLLTQRWMKLYHGSASEKVQIVDEAANAMKNMASKQLQELYVLELSRQLDVDMGWVRRALAQSIQALAPKTLNTGGNQPNSGGGGGGGFQQGGSFPQGGPSRPGQMNAGPSRPGAGGQPSNNRGASGPAQGHGSANSVTGSAAQGSPQANRASDARSEAPNGETSGQTEDLTEARPERVSLKGAPKDEVFVMSLLLYRESLTKELVDSGGAEELAQIITHPGVREVLKRGFATYRAKPDNFSSIAANLAVEVDQPAALSMALPMLPNEAPEGSERKLLHDYLQALRKRFQKNQGRVLAQALKDRPDLATLEKVQALQRDRLRPESDEE